MTVSQLFGAWFDNFPQYDSDESAYLDGLQSGDAYRTASNHKTLRAGLLIVLE
jgi:hypothetical protein